MNKLYVACDLGAENGRVMLGTLHQDKLMVSEVRRFPNLPVKEKDSVHWDIAQLYQETLLGLREVSKYDEAVESISCNSWASDYLLFDSDGKLITPTYHSADPRTVAGMKAVFNKVGWQEIYDETGVQKTSDTTLFQLGSEKSRRLRRTAQLMPVADGFNYLLSGVPRVEISSASATQLYNPITRNWSDELLHAVDLPAALLPQIVPGGTPLGLLRADIARETQLEDVHVVAGCSDALAAALAGLPVNIGENWAYLQLGSRAIMGTTLNGAIISDESRDLDFTNEMGYGGSVRFSRRAPGLWLLDECHRYWKETDHALEDNVLTHLAISSQPFESLINPSDPRFLTPGDMPLKIQAFCKETRQSVPRKPGPIVRCVLESLALHYRKTLRQMNHLTGREIKRLFVLDDASNSLLNHFTANALQIPVVFAPADATAIGNVIVQAVALGHIKSLAEAREIVRNSFKLETIYPHAAVWNAAYDRFSELPPA